MRFRWLVTASLLAVCVGMAACGGDDDDDNAATGGQAAKLSGEIETWIMDPGTPELQDVFKGYVSDFQAANPGTTVNLQFVPWAQAHDKFTTAIAGGSGPDVAEMGTTWTPEFAALGAFNEVPSSDGEYVSSLVDAGSVDGTAYGRPWYAGARAFIYRSDIFEKLGLQAPASWDDIEAAAAKIKAEGDGIYPIGVTGLTEHYYLPTVWQNGGEIAEEDGDAWKSDMSQPEAVEAIQFYTDLYKQGYAPKAAITWEEPDARTAFINGKIAMMWAGPWDYDAIVTEKPGLEGKVGVTLVPAGPSGDRSAFAGGSHLVTFKESENPDLASAFVDFLLEPEQVNTFTGRIGFLPGTVSGIEASGMLDDEVKAPFAEQLKDHSQVYPPSPKWGALEGQNIFDGAIQAVMKGDETPEQAAQEISQKMDEALRRALINTVVFGTVAVAVTMAFGMAVALLLNQRFRGRALLTVLVVLPWAMPAIAASSVWRWMFNDQYGLVNWVLVRLGASSFQDYSWFSDRLPAFAAILVVVVWQSYPFIAFATLAGLQTLPKDVLDAAKVDGATAWQRFRFVTLPLLRPIVAVLAVISTIWNFKIFDQVYVLAAGVPERATDTAAVAAYRLAFASSEFGLGSAMAVVLFLILLAVTLLYMKLLRGQEAT